MAAPCKRTLLRRAEAEARNLPRIVNLENAEPIPHQQNEAVQYPFEQNLDEINHEVEPEQLQVDLHRQEDSSSTTDIDNRIRHVVNNDDYLSVGHETENSGLHRNDDLINSHGILLQPSLIGPHYHY